MKDITPEVLHKEINLIQSCITRMANNSFYIKGWALSIVAVVLALYDKDANISFIAFIPILPVIGFWYLDAYYLRLECQYRQLYKWVVVERTQGRGEYLYDLNPHRFDKDVMCVQETMLSKSLALFYGIPLSCLVIIVFFGNCI